MITQSKDYRTEQDSTRFIDLISSCILLVYRAYILTFIYLPFLICAGLLVRLTGQHKGLPDFHTPYFSHELASSVLKFVTSLSGDKIVEIFALAYLLFCLLYVLKGSMIMLRNQHKCQWRVLMACCLPVTLILPTLIVQLSVYALFSSIAGSGPVVFIMSWISAVIPGYLIYRKYNLKTDSAPHLVFWAYTLGGKLAGRKSDTVKKAIPVPLPEFIH